MEYDLFRNKVQQVKAKKPILFALETDTPPSIDKIEDFEKIYRMVLPEKYKLFIIYSKIITIVIFMFYKFF